jgi:hypothetical protein
MDILSAQVLHKRYGPGCVIQQSANIITVEFSGQYGVKRFLYPSIFENYMALSSHELQARQLEEIRLLREEFEAIMLQKTEEEAQRRLIEKAALKKTKSVRSKGTGRRLVPDDNK